MTTEPNTITFHNSNADWVMRITADRRIEVNEDVKVTEAAQKVLDAVQYLLKAQPAPQFKAVSDPRLMEHQFTVQQILEAFPLVADEGLDQEKHCCEWALQQDRKRLHAMLATPPLPAQEPVGSVRWGGDEVVWTGEPPESGALLYTTPPLRPWVGLTDEDITKIDQGLYPTWKDEVQAIEARLKELNTCQE